MSKNKEELLQKAVNVMSNYATGRSSQDEEREPAVRGSGLTAIIMIGIVIVVVALGLFVFK